MILGASECRVRIFKHQLPLVISPSLTVTQKKRIQPTDIIITIIQTDYKLSQQPYIVFLPLDLHHHSHYFFSVLNQPVVNFISLEAHLNHYFQLLVALQPL